MNSPSASFTLRRRAFDATTACSDAEDDEASIEGDATTLRKVRIMM
jgi:hypothetical protein